MIYNSNLYILTGGSGAGKTTVLRELANRGYICVGEVAREIIRQQVAMNGKALPWSDTELYARLMLVGSVRDFADNSGRASPCFFDRGIPDTLAYARLSGLKLDTESEAEALTYRYNRMVFLFPPWESVYCTDAERKQDFRLAAETCCEIEKKYRELDYELVRVPLVEPSHRADFIIGKICDRKPGFV